MRLSKEALAKVNERDFLLTALKDALGDQKNAYENLAKCLEIYIHVIFDIILKGIISIEELAETLDDMFESKGLYLDKLLNMLSYRNAPRRQDTWLCKQPSRSFPPKSHINQGSYIKLPEDYPKVVCTGKEAEVAEELNNDWISVVTGSEHCSFKVMRKNQYEEQLFNCEDERFELDMAISSYAAAIEALEKIQSEAIAAHNEGRHYEVDKRQFSNIRFKAVHETYEEVTEGMLENLCVQPLKTCEFMLKRLGRNMKGSKQQRDRNKEIWRELCENNFYKSLDHKSFYFRQSEKKNLNTKGKFEAAP